MGEKKCILTASQVDSKLKRMAFEIAENNWQADELIFLGITGPGEVVAKKIQEYTNQITSVNTIYSKIELDKRHPQEVAIVPQIGFDEKIIILVDDVLDSGKTMLYALKPLLNFRPAKIQTAVLVCRNHNSFPVHPDYIGLDISTTLKENIRVETEAGVVTGAYLI